MPPRQQPRHIARQLALLSLSQLHKNEEKLEQQDLNDLVLAAIRTLAGEARDALELAATEVKRASDRLFESENRAPDVQSARVILGESLESAQKALNYLSDALDLPEFINLANRQDVRDYALTLVTTVRRRRVEIEAMLEKALIDWDLKRLAKIDRGILSLAVAEILFLDVKVPIAINEAVELAKSYSDHDGYRFINGVLRKVSDIKKAQTLAASSAES